MGFLSPWFLAGIVAVGLPLYLHLLRQYKRTPQPFSSLMFFERRIQSSVKHRRLRYLLLLSLRLLLLILLALTFANPFVNRASETVTRRRLTVIAIDRSFSMREGGRLAQAKVQAHSVLNSLGGRDFAQIMAVDSHVENLSQAETDRGVLSAAIDSIQPGDAASSFGEFARALRVMDQTTGMQLHVHLFSDMQQTSMPAFRDLMLGPHTALDLHQIGQANARNWAVETVTTASHVYDSARTRLTATIAGWHTNAAPRTVSLVLDGKVLGTKQVNVPANGRVQTEFLSFDVPYGAHRGEVQITPRDNLPNDDAFPFSVERSDPRRVLFLYAGGRSHEAFYYKAAMESASDTGLNVQTAAVEQAGNIDFSKFAFVVLSDVGDLDSAVAQRLCSFVSKGGAVLIALGPGTIRAARVPLSGDHLAELRETQGVGFVDTQNSALLGTGRFDNVQFTNAARLAPKPNARVLSKLADGSPLLVEESMGEGRVLVFAGMLDNSNTDFPLHASFLPFVVQTGRYLAGTEDTASSTVVGTPIALRRTRDESTPAGVVGPDGKRLLSLSEATKALSFDVQQNGFYEVQRADGRRLLVAAHADRRESDLTTVPPDTLALWRNTGSTAPEARSGTVERQTKPVSLWRYAMVLLLAAALIESLFASRYLKEERQTA